LGEVGIGTVKQSVDDNAAVEVMEDEILVMPGLYQGAVRFAVFADVIVVDGVEVGFVIRKTLMDYTDVEMV